MTTLGMDTEAARLASNDLEGGADQIRGLAQRLDAALLGLDWSGSDAERVRASWQEQERRQLDLAAEHLHGLVTLLRREADAQDAASGDGTGGGGGGALGPATSTGLQPQTVGEDGEDGGLAGWISRHVGAYLQGAGRTLEHAGDLVGKIGDVLTGERDWSAAAIAASAVATVGSSIGTTVNGITGEDQHWFDERAGHADGPVAVPTDPAQASQFQPALTRPTDLPSLMQGVTDGYQVGLAPGSNGDVRVTRIDNPGGTAYVVAVPGTENWSPSAGGQPRDSTANLALVSANPSAAAESVQRAMEAAGVPPGSRVMLVGHSQGGIIAAQLASDPAFAERYGVTHVLTYGSPVDHLRMPPGVNLMQVQHGADLVPRLDFGGISASGALPERAPTVTLGSPGGFWEIGVNHSHTEYLQSVRDAMAGDTDAGRTLRDYQATLAPYLVAPGGTATAVDVPVRRGN